MTFNKCLAMLKKRLSERQKKILKVLKEETSKGYVLTVKDIERITGLSYSTVYDNLLSLEEQNYVKRVKIRIRGRWSKRRYWVGR